MVDQSGETGYGTSIAVDEQDGVHICYTNKRRDQLCYASRTAGEWKREVVESASSERMSVSGSTALAVDAGMCPHVGFYDIHEDSRWYLKYAYKEDSQWSIAVVDPDVKNFYNDWGVSIAVGSGRIQLVYYDWGTWDLNFAWKTADSAWMIETVDAQGFVGAYASMALDAEGYPHVGYMDNNNLDVKYAKKLQYRPGIPQAPSGPHRGEPGESYTYSTVSVDPDGDRVMYRWDWDDGTAAEWTDLYGSGETVEMNHTWSERGEYAVRVQAEDEHGYQSAWSPPLSVTMPKKREPRMTSVFKS